MTTRSKFRRVRTPVGELTLVRTDSGLCAILWEGDPADRVRLPRQMDEMADEASDDDLLGETERQLAEYFAGLRRAFQLPLDPRGTAFQKAVWRELSLIPFGGTVSYGAVAKRLGTARLARAVGSANRANPLSIVVPCHRVVGVGGDLVGFAGGLEVKRYLLDHERSRSRHGVAARAAV